MTTLQKELQDLVSTVRERSGVPGISVSLGVAGERMSAAAGTRAVGDNDPISAESRFHIGCITKLLTSLIAFDLVSKNKLSLHAPIKEYLPELSETRVGSEVLVWHLGCHTSGYRGLNVGLPQFAYFYSWPKFRAFLRETTQMFLGGTTFNYEHTECVILGEIIRRVEGRPLEALVQKKIIGPLNLRIDVTNEGEPGWEDVVADHSFDASTKRYRRIRTVPFCDFWTPSLSNWTAGTADLRRLAEVMAGSVAHCDIAAEAINGVRAQRVSLPPVSGGSRCEQIPLSFGFGCAEYDGQLFGHNGSGRGQTCGFRFDAGRRLGIVVALNSWQPYVRDLLLNAVARLIAPSESVRTLPLSKLDLSLRDLEGTYFGCMEGFRVVVSRVDNTLTCELYDSSGEPKTHIVMAANDEGRLVMNSDAQHLSIGFFRETFTDTPCLMLGLNAFKKAF